MKVWISTFFAISTVLAADSPNLALTIKAQTDYDRVQLAPLPQLADTGNCVQSQAAALSVSPPEESALLYFRRGYCRLAGASITSSAADFTSAAADFDRAIEAWPLRMRKAPKKQAPEPVSSGIRILAWVARLHADSSDIVRGPAHREIASAAGAPACLANLMPTSECDQITAIGSQWLGWMALRDRQIDEAARDFAGSQGTGWPEWVEGQRLFQQEKFAEAASREEQAISVWRAAWQSPTLPVIRRLGPPPDLAVAFADLGGAQLLAGDAKRALETLNASIKLNSDNPQAIFRRARAHEAAGQSDAALADYGLAARVAFAAAQDLASGEAHLYRGILLYRRKEFGRAENEFASALNFEIAAPLRGDAQAWRHLSAVAGGSCASAREFLDRALLTGVSPYFPKVEARQLASACGASAKAESR